MCSVLPPPSQSSAYSDGRRLRLSLRTVCTAPPIKFLPLHRCTVATHPVLCQRSASTATSTSGAMARRCAPSSIECTTTATDFSKLSHLHHDLHYQLTLSVDFHDRSSPARMSHHLRCLWSHINISPATRCHDSHVCLCSLTRITGSAAVPRHSTFRRSRTHRAPRPAVPSSCWPRRLRSGWSAR